MRWVLTVPLGAVGAPPADSTLHLDSFQFLMSSETLSSGSLRAGVARGRVSWGLVGKAIWTPGVSGVQTNRFY